MLSFQMHQLPQPYCISYTAKPKPLNAKQFRLDTEHSVTALTVSCTVTRWYDPNITPLLKLELNL